MRRDAPDVQRVVRVEELGAVLARRDVDQRSAGVQRHPDARVVRRAPAVAGVATQGTRLAAAASHHCDTSYTLPRSTSQQSPGVLCCATSLSENPLPARTTAGGARCDDRLPSGGIRGYAQLLGRTGAKLAELYRNERALARVSDASTRKRRGVLSCKLDKRGGDSNDDRRFDRHAPASYSSAARVIIAPR